MASKKIYAITSKEPIKSDLDYGIKCGPVLAPLWTILQKVLKEPAALNSFMHSPLQRAKLVNEDLKFTERLITHLLHPKNLVTFFKKLRP